MTHRMAVARLLNSIKIFLGCSIFCDITDDNPAFWNKHARCFLKNAQPALDASVDRMIGRFANITVMKRGQRNNFIYAFSFFFKSIDIIIRKSEQLWCDGQFLFGDYLADTRKISSEYIIGNNFPWFCCPCKRQSKIPAAGAELNKPFS